MPNSFYRFNSAWNAGFFPDNQITANLLNALAGNINGWLPTYFSGKTILQLFNGVKQQVDVFNVSPYFGDLVTKINYLTNTDFVITVFNPSLLATDDTQIIIIIGSNDMITKVVSGATMNPFTVGSYSGTFDAPAIAVEQEVARAFQIVDQNGSAFFPMTYSYNAISGIATSGLARGKNWQLDSSGNPVRLPADTLPKQNARTFNVAPQTAEDRYCISLMEKVINYSFTETDETLIQAYFNTFSVPDGWTASFAISIDTYTRIFCLMYRDDRSLLIIGRKDVKWLWQRFINESGSTDFSVFNYSATTPLPYLPTISYQWLYGDWYDMEFVNFNSGCYEPKEFYAMPAISGDSLQFNVTSDSGNLTGISSASVGLFTQDGQFVQRIGDIFNKYTISFIIPNATPPFSPFYIGATILVGIGNNIPVDELDYLTYFPLVFSGLGASPTPEDFAIFINDRLTSPSYGYYDSNYYFNGTNWVVNWVVYSYLSDLLTIPNNNYIGSLSWGGGVVPNDFEFFLEGVNSCNTQFQAKVLIPSVANGCYRMGLYSESESGFYLYSLSNIIDLDSADCFSTMVEFWGDDGSIAQGFEYYNGWFQRVRLGINGGGKKPVINESVYRQSNGVFRRPSNKQDYSIDLHTDFIDTATQMALVDATRHPSFVVNQENLFVQGDIEVATIQDFTTQSSFEDLAQVKFSALIQGYQPKNSTCINC